MEFEHRSGIYMCTCNINGRSYIGQSQDVKLRRCHHLSELRSGRHFNQHLQRAYDKYKEYNFSWTVLEYCNEDILDDREMYWIAYYDTYKNGFNANEGGRANRSFDKTDEFKEKMSVILKDVWANADDRRKEFSQRMSGENNPMYGKTGELNPAYGQDRSGEKNGMYGKYHSEESKELNRQAHFGAKNKMSKPVVCIETQVVFASQGEAGRIMNCSSSTINKCCRGVKRSAGGYHWRYATQEDILNQTHIA